MVTRVILPLSGVTRYWRTHYDTKRTHTRGREHHQCFITSHRLDEYLFRSSILPALRSLGADVESDSSNQLVALDHQRWHSNEERSTLRLPAEDRAGEIVSEGRIESPFDSDFLPNA